MDDSVMILWLKYLKELELACAASAGAADAKTMCEDEEWGNESEAMPGEPRTPSSGAASPASAASPAASTAASPVASTAASPPRLRLNTSLATDPALAPLATVLKRELPSPSPPAAPPAALPPQPRDYLAVAAAAFPGLFPAAGPPGYVCKPCGIRYSSLSTLQAHQEHYCTNRRPKPDGTDSPADANADESSGDSKTPRPPNRQYQCTYCSYSADKKVSLNRHMRMHSSSPVSSGTPAPTPTSNGETAGSPPAPDRYCTDCDIRFSSIKTYRAHKSHYCSTRQVVKNPAAPTRGSSVTSGSAPPSPGPTPPAGTGYALALPTTPILILPIGLLRNASTLPGTTLPDPDTPCFLLPNGTFQPFSALPNLPTEGKAAEVLKSANRPRENSRDGGQTPLDLSMRRTPESVKDEHEKENRMRSTTPEQIVCAPSLPGSPGTPSPSPRRSSSPIGEVSPKRRRRNSSRGPTPKPPSVPSPPEEKFNPGPPALLPPGLAMRLAAGVELPVTTASPQVLVKQGVSKCKECNIVFCKYENYRIHKRHYCSAGGEERASPAPEPGPPPQYRQLICLACGIHFSSLDNLTTHQSYYCTKRETRSPRGAVAAPVVEARVTTGTEGGWKCPCCDVVSPTAAAAQRHMEAHAGVKAFRCTICRYRGNTLRGMRTHIRMHFNNKKPADMQEESYIACVLEDDSREATSPSPAATGERVHRCSSCAYTSTYRGNVVRHARLVHATEEPEEEKPDPSPPIPITVTTVDIKKEPGTEEETPNYCKSCDISFKYVNTYKAHKQFYCTANNQDAAANNNVPVPRVSDAAVL